MKLYDLKTLHMTEALGIDKQPYFSWKMDSDLKNVMQEAYQVTVRSKDKLVWDSGRITSEQQSFVVYEGVKLKSKTDYVWEVTVWDNKGESAKGQSSFETALLSEEEWKAKWIECSIKRETVNEYKYGGTSPAVFFKKTFNLEQSVKRARVYSTAYGVYRLRVNEERPDDREFAPEFTVYNKVMYYQTYDITSMLKPGSNSLDMYVGDGWFFSDQAGLPSEHSVEEPAVLFQIELEYVDGQKEVIASDGTEKCALGMVEYSDLFQGEKQDLRKEFQNFEPVAVKDFGYNHLKAQPMPPCRPIKLVPAVDVFTSPKGETIVDFGQVMAGRARIHIDVPEGQEICFEYFEVLDTEGNYLNTMFAPQKDIVISAGEPVVHEVLFTFHGFRYVRVTGMEAVDKKDFTAVLLTTEKANASTFESSDKRLNRLYENIRWSQYNNMMSIPTDCPSREKAGWTGDLLIYAKTAMLNEEMTPFLTSWLDNVEADQADNGNIMITTPYTKLYDTVFTNVAKGYGDDQATGVAGWSDAIVWIPYRMYEMTGNTLILEDKYVAMKKWTDYIITTAKNKRGEMEIDEELDQYLWNTGFHFGEWLIPSRPTPAGTSDFDICKESSFYIAPYFGYETVRMMSQISGLVGNASDQQYYEETASKMKNAIREALMYQDRLPKNLMGAYVLAFAFDLVPEDLKKEYDKRLIDLIEDNDGCLDTGFLATPYIMDVVDQLGHKSLAQSLLWQNKRPSWLYEVEHGATAIWEAWDADEAMKSGRYVSYDHYAFGCVDEWLVKKIAGIDSEIPAYRHLIIKPELDGRLTFCKRTFECESGQVMVDWNEDRMMVKIPCNTTATVTWKGVVHELGSGIYTLK